MRGIAVMALLVGTAACAHASVPAAAPRPTAPAADTPATPAPERLEPRPIKAGEAPPPGTYEPGFDAIHYSLDLVLPDTGTLIRGRMIARFAVVPPRQDTLVLDLTGLAVDGVEVGPAHAGYRYETDGKLRIAVPATTRAGDTLLVDVQYHGHPDDGLIVRPNVHGQRTAFADDWPNRARFWFPSIDHPSDKATVEMRVHAPADWQAVANGPEESAAGAAAGEHAWRMDVPIPTYTVVFGAGRLVRRELPGAAAGAGGRPVPVGVWLFPEDTAGLKSFRRATDIVAWFSSLIAPFPYPKLDHVESSTRFGGMENAGAIFYDEKAIAGGHDIESTVAHETAHQWFGDSVTETDWHHLWLSEGFATYFGALFFEHADGEARFREMMRSDRDQWLMSADTARPVIDPSERDLFALLNANNYQKGAWVLHMLRGLVGDSAFFDGIRRYYRAHASGNALTADLQRAMEQASGRELGWFFHQWLEEPGFPRLRLAWQWNAASQQVEVTVTQVQSAAWPTFRLPLTLLMATSRGSVRREIEVTGRHQTFRLPAPAAPTSLTADPDARLLGIVEVHGR